MFTLTFQISKVKQEYDQLQQMKLEKVFSTYVEKRLSSEDKVVLILCSNGYSPNEWKNIDDSGESKNVSLRTNLWKYDSNRLSLPRILKSEKSPY